MTLANALFTNLECTFMTLENDLIVNLELTNQFRMCVYDTYKLHIIFLTVIVTTDILNTNNRVIRENDFFSSFTTADCLTE